MDIEDRSPLTLPSNEDLLSSEIQAPDTKLREWLGTKSELYLTNEMEIIKVALFCCVLDERDSLDSNGSNILL